AEARMEGPDALGVVIEQLEGFEAPAGAWEKEMLPARLGGYKSTWLDDQCRSGRVAWMRLRPAGRGRQDGASRRVGAVKAAPLALLPRRYAGFWRAPAGKEMPSNPKANARKVADYIRGHGASFFDDLVGGTGLLRTQVEDALAELVALGLANSDSFGGLRVL